MKIIRDSLEKLLNDLGIVDDKDTNDRIIYEVFKLIHEQDIFNKLDLITVLWSEMVVKNMLIKVYKYNFYKSSFLSFRSLTFGYMKLYKEHLTLDKSLVRFNYV